MVSDGYTLPPRKKKDYTPTYLTDVEILDKGFEIIELLRNLPLRHALCILDSTKDLILDCHTVDTKNPQYSEVIKSIAKYEKEKQMPYSGHSKIIERLLRRHTK